MNSRELSPVEQSFTRAQIFKLWVIVTVPLALLAWLVVPLVVYRINVPAVLTYWALLMVGMAWQMAVALSVISRQEGNLRWETIRRFIRLNRPRNPKDGSPTLRPFWRMFLSWPVIILCLSVGTLLPVLFIVLRRFTSFDYYGVPGLRWPAYANLTELASSEFAGQWGLLLAAFLGWGFCALCAEELFFRGVLLPRMQGAFGEKSARVNALLYAGYHLFQYWLIPFRFIEGLFIARQSRRFSSFWPAVVIRSVEGLATLALVLGGIMSQSLTTLPVAALPYISSRPAPATYGRGILSTIPSYDPAKAGNPVDLRGADVSALDLRDEGTTLPYADFDTYTTWPTADQMPTDFDAAHILELGKNPGLGVRALHAQGITGKGVGIAIIDQPLFIEHQEYVERLRWYEEIPGSMGAFAQMHGSALASLAAGKTVGVAPEADVYYIGGAGSSVVSILFYNHEYAQAIRRIVQINEQLSPERKIRVISISSDWLPFWAGYQDAVLAVREAEAAGILVISVGKATGLPGSVSVMGLGRHPLTDPDVFESYEPGSWWAANFFAGSAPRSWLLVPMDSRTLASPKGPQDYEFNRFGGMSWVPPTLAGLYALAVQVDPAITPEQFWTVAQQTGRTIPVAHEGQSYPLGVLVDPVALITTLSGQ